MRCTLVLLASLIGFVFPATATAQPDKAKPSARDIFQQTLRGTAWVLTKEGSGTAWVLDAGQRQLVTNFHVVMRKDKSSGMFLANEEVIVVFPASKSGKTVYEREYYLDNRAKLGRTAKVIATFREADLALLQLDELPEGVKALTVAKDRPEPADTIHSVGNPGASGSLWVYTSGTVRTLNRRKVAIEDIPFDFRAIETQSPINPGDSGGPVLNDRGEVVGVVQSQGGQLISTVIDVREVRTMVLRHLAVRTPMAWDEFHNRANGEFDKGNWDRAIADYSKAIELNPTYSPSWVGRGGAYVHKGDYDRGLADLDKGIALDPKSGLAYAGRAIANSQKQRFRQAIDDATLAIKLGEKSASLYATRAFAYGRVNDQRMSEQDYSAAIVLNDKYAVAYHGRGLARWNLKNYRGAEADLQQALRHAVASDNDFIREVRKNLDDLLKILNR